MFKEYINTLSADAVALLQQLISIPSLSKEEDRTATFLQQFLQSKGVKGHRLLNNVWASNKHFDPAKPTILLNSHHDTVGANAAYSRDPFDGSIEDGKLYGLGSTDAGAALVSLLAAFLYFYEAAGIPYNIVFAGTAEEEISGTNGIELLFKQEAFNACFAHPDCFAIVGEPTQLDLAIAEKGLLVLDCEATGRAGHAARDEGDNAIYIAMEAINWFRDFRFEKVSPLLGPNKMSVTAINTVNKAHNVVPAVCHFVVDIRINEMYTHEEVIDIIKGKVDVTITPRSTRLRSSAIAEDHPVVQAGVALGKKTFGSPTCSDQGLIALPSLKCGPGFSGESHAANEFVAVQDIEDAVAFYVGLLKKLNGGRVVSVAGDSNR